MISLEHFLFIKTLVDDPNVVFQAFAPERKAQVQTECGDIMRHTLFEKALWRHVVYDKKVIVKIHEMISNPRNLMQINFQHTGVETGKKCLWYIIFVVDQV